MLRLKLRVSERRDSHRIPHAFRLLRVSMIRLYLICSTGIFLLAFASQDKGVRHVGSLVLGRSHVEKVMRGVELLRLGCPSFLRSETTLIGRIAPGLAPGPLDALSHLLLLVTTTVYTEIEGPRILLVVLTHVNAAKRRFSRESQVPLLLGTL